MLQPSFAAQHCHLVSVKEDCNLSLLLVQHAANTALCTIQVALPCAFSGKKSAKLCYKLHTSDPLLGSTGFSSAALTSRCLSMRALEAARSSELGIP